VAPATLEIKVSSFRSANRGPVRAEGWLQRLGRSIAFFERRVTTPGGDVLAMATSTVKAVPTDRRLR
jgi:acyl-CoA thioesterase